MYRTKSNNNTVDNNFDFDGTFDEHIIAHGNIRIGTSGGQIGHNTGDILFQDISLDNTTGKLIISSFDCPQIYLGKNHPGSILTGDIYSEIITYSSENGDESGDSRIICKQVVSATQNQYSQIHRSGTAWSLYLQTRNSSDMLNEPVMKVYRDETTNNAVMEFDGQIQSRLKSVVVSTNGQQYTIGNDIDIIRVDANPGNIYFPDQIVNPQWSGKKVIIKIDSNSSAILWSDPNTSQKIEGNLNFKSYTGPKYITAFVSDIDNYVYIIGES